MRRHYIFPNHLAGWDGLQREALGTGGDLEADRRLHRPDTNGHMSMKRNAEEEEEEEIVLLLCPETHPRMGRFHWSKPASDHLINLVSNGSYTFIKRFK